MRVFIMAKGDRFKIPQIEGICKIEVLLHSEEDIDAFTFLCGDEGMILDDANLVFYNSKNREVPFDKAVFGNMRRWMSQTRPMSADGAVIASFPQYYGDVVNVNLDKVDPSVSEIVFAAALYDGDRNGGGFENVRDAYISVINAENHEELCRYELNEAFTTETSVSVARLIKNEDGDWEFEAMGMGHAGGIETLIDIYAS